MDLIEISYFELMLAGLLVILLAAVSWWARLGIGHRFLIAAVRTVIQLSLIALVLEAIFDAEGFLWIALMATVMLLVAGREVANRQSRRFVRGQSFAIGTFSMFVSGFSVTLFSLLVIIGPDPWYSPQYAIPLLGMMLGNTMNGVAVSLDRLTQSAWEQRAVIETRLMLGHTWQDAIGYLRRDAMRSGMIPTINGHGHGWHCQSTRHDDRPDTCGHCTSSGCALSDPDHADDCGGYRIRNDGWRFDCQPAAV